MLFMGARSELFLDTDGLSFWLWSTPFGKNKSPSGGGTFYEGNIGLTVLVF